MPTPPQTATVDTTTAVIRIGIDWADREHFYYLLDPQGEDVACSFSQHPADIQRTIETWRTNYPDALFEVAIEQSRGPLINALAQYEDVIVFPVNPAKLAYYRKSFAHGGGKNDPADARLLALYLDQHRQELRPLRCDQPLTRELAALTEHRRGFVDQRTKLVNQLTAVLKAYFPAALALQPNKPYALFFVAFLRKYPTLAAAQRPGRTRLRKFFYGVGAKRTVEERLDTILQAQPLTEDPVVLRSSARRMLGIVHQLAVLNETIKGYDVEIAQRVISHADYRVVAALPGAGANTQARILAALGDDRRQFHNANALQAAAGIAPITTQSGQQKTVSRRWACTKFMKQTFHEYAGTSTLHCGWAQAFEKLQRSRGKSTHAARRALAYKWIRIIYRCWQNGQAYDESHYLQRLRANNSPLLAFLPEPKTAVA